MKQVTTKLRTLSLLAVLMAFMTTSTFAQNKPNLSEGEPAPLFFSEYIEGSSNNKALEIYNPTADTVWLANYQIEQASNGGGWEFYFTFADNAFIAPSETYVLITDEVNTELFAPEDADEVLAYPSPIHFNGDDARALVYITTTDTTRLDVFGDPDNDPGTAWDVGGVANATKDKTLVRKPGFTGNSTILDSFGTDDASSEWIVSDQDDFSDLGMHQFLGIYDITFQLDMNGPIDSAQFVPSLGHIVTVAGSMNGWNATADTLTDADADGIYTITLSIEEGNYEYKYVTEARAGISGWDDGDNRPLAVTADAVLDVETLNKTYSDISNAIFGDVALNFAVNMSIAKDIQGIFKPDEGDVLMVAGSFPGRDWATGVDASYTFSESSIFGEGVYENEIIFEDQTIGSTINYKYIIVDGVDGVVTWESGDNKVYTITDTDGTTDDGEFISFSFDDPNNIPYFNNITPADVFTEEGTVRFTVDLRPAYYHLADSSKLPEDVQDGSPSTAINGLYANGPLVGTFNGTDWASWGVTELGANANVAFYDDGTNGDVTAGDSVWSRSFTYPVGASKLGVIKMGINGQDNESGFGVDRTQRIEDGGTYRMVFGAVLRSDGKVIDDLYDPYILVTEDEIAVVRRGGEGDDDVIHTDLEEVSVDLPSTYVLNQNYPNPFNPSTLIKFSLANSSKVTLEVYNLLGQRITVLVNGQQMPAGEFNVNFDASRLASGVYIYRLTAGDFTSTKKMTLIK